MELYSQINLEFDIRKKNLLKIMCFLAPCTNKKSNKGVEDRDGALQGDGVGSRDA